MDALTQGQTRDEAAATLRFPTEEVMLFSGENAGNVTATPRDKLIGILDWRAEEARRACQL